MCLFLSYLLNNSVFVMFCSYSSSYNRAPTSNSRPDSWSSSTGHQGPHGDHRCVAHTVLGDGATMCPGILRNSRKLASLCRFNQDKGHDNRGSFGHYHRDGGYGSSRSNYDREHYRGDPRGDHRTHHYRQDHHSNYGNRPPDDDRNDDR